MELKVVAYAHNGFSQKFGIPRQSREDSCIETRIVFESDYRVREALRGIEDYSYLWLVWGFHEAIRHKIEEAKDELQSWSPTVRPPRLGGNKRMGVFATRSPFRPNPIGLTSVKLLRLEETDNDGLVLVVSGWKMTGKLAGLGIMVLGVIFLLAALMVYNKPYETPSRRD